MDIAKLSDKARKFFEMIEFDADEQMICEIRKHWFGLFIIYATGLFVGLAIFLLLVVGALFIQSDVLGIGASSKGAQVGMVLIGGLLTILTAVGTLIGAFLYKSNVVLVTSEKIAQVLYTSIFDRKISQLSMGDVHDVTVKQVGIFARIFNYGTLVIETAGEQANFIFSFTPEPYERAKDIVGAHERNVAQFGN